MTLDWAVAENKQLDGIIEFCSLDKANKRFRNARTPYRHGFGFELAELRMRYGRKHQLSENGCFVAEASLFFYDGRQDKIKRALTKNNPILLSKETVKTATDACASAEEFYLDDEQLEWALQDSIALPLENVKIPVSRFGEDGLTVGFYGNGDSKKAKDYGHFLDNAGEKEMEVWVPPIDYVRGKLGDKRRAYAREFFVGAVDITTSRMGGYHFGIVGNMGVFGVRYISVFQGQRKSFQVQFRKALGGLKRIIDKI